MSKPIVTTPSGKVERKLLARRQQSEIAKLKRLWRDTLPDDDKEFWRQLFAGPEESIEDIRDLIREKFQIDLRHNRQIYSFREWELEQRQYDLQDERVAEKARRIREEHPGWDKNQIREELLKETYIHSKAIGDYPLGLQAMRTDAHFGTLELNREKFKESLRAKIKTGMEALADEADKNPAIKAAVDQLRQALAPE